MPIRTLRSRSDRESNFVRTTSRRNANWRRRRRKSISSRQKNVFQLFLLFFFFFFFIAICQFSLQQFGIIISIVRRNVLLSRRLARNRTRPSRRRTSVALQTNLRCQRNRSRKIADSLRQLATADRSHHDGKKRGKISTSSRLFLSNSSSTRSSADKSNTRKKFSSNLKMNALNFNANIVRLMITFSSEWRRCFIFERSSSHLERENFSFKRDNNKKISNFSWWN